MCSYRVFFGLVCLTVQLSFSVCSAESVQMIESKEAFTDFMKRNEDKLTVVNFYAAWLGPCKMIAPVFEEMAATIPGVACGKVDVDESDDVAAEYKISSMPTFIFFKYGEKVDTMVGANADKLRGLIYRYAR
ncbi:PREDICTED: thioredoxin-like isoform X2 [Branchiostoma belcheri]|uniref:Thioredoxin-like isoform X2 n=1 Tax=Branchiostoma belcheri TaxID=7741 RepID=A0A6P4Z3U3_BRABE|nr:PREDICTED: thioredoxin-like isoform X2 [Branchiostoma belcheri]